MNKKIISFTLAFLMILQCIYPIDVFAKNERLISVSVNGISMENNDITDEMKGKDDDDDLSKALYDSLPGINLSIGEEITLEIQAKNNGHSIKKYKYEVFEIEKDFDDGEFEYELDDEDTEWRREGGNKEYDDDKWIEINGQHDKLIIDLDDDYDEELVIKIDFIYKNGRVRGEKWIGVINKKGGSEPEGKVELAVEADSIKNTYEIGEEFDVNYLMKLKNTTSEKVSNFKISTFTPIVKQNGSNENIYKEISQQEDIGIIPVDDGRKKAELKLKSNEIGEYTFGATIEYEYEIGEGNSKKTITETVIFDDLIDINIENEMVDTTEYLEFNIKTEKDVYEINENIEVDLEINPKDILIDEVGDNRKKQVVIVMDTSGSMSEKINRKEKIKIAKEESRKLLERFTNMNDIEVIVVPFNDYAENIYNNDKVLEFSKDSTSENAISKISNLRANGGTNIGDAIRVALNCFNDEYADKHMILFTDGEPTYRSIYKKGQHPHNNECGGEYTCKYEYWNNRYYYTGDYIHVNRDNEFIVFGTGNSDSLGYNKEYAELMGELCRESGIQSTVVGFSNGISQSTIKDITESLGGEYAMATDANELEKVFSKFYNNISNTINFTNISVKLTVPEGMQFISSSHNTSYNETTRELTVELPNLTYVKQGDKYVASDTSIDLKLAAKSTGSKRLNGKVYYTNHIGNEKEQPAEKEILITNKKDIEYLSVELKSPKSVLKNSEFIVHNNISFKDILKSNITNDDDEGLVLNNVNIVIKIDENIYPVNHKEYGYIYNEKNSTLEKKIDNIKYILDDQKYTKDPIKEALLFNTIEEFIGDVQIQSEVKYENEIKNSKININIVEIDEVSTMQSADKSIIKSGDILKVDYLVSGNKFLLDGAQSMELSNARVDITIPNSLQLEKDGKIYHVGEVYTLNLGDITFTKDENGYYIPSDAVKDILEFKVIGNKEGELIKLGGTLMYEFEGYELEEPLEDLSLKVSPEAPELTLNLSKTLSEIDPEKNNSELELSADVECKVSIAVCDLDGNIINEIAEDMEISKGEKKPINIEDLSSGSYIRVKAENTSEEVGLTATSEETVPLIDVELMLPSSKPSVGDEGYERIGSLYISTDNKSKIDKIKVDGIIVEEDRIINGSIYESENHMFKNGPNSIEIIISKQGNISTLKIERCVDATPPPIEIAESNVLKIKFTEYVKENFIIQIGGEEFNKKKLDELKILSGIQNNGKGILSMELTIPDEWKGKKMKVTAEDLSGNIGEKEYTLSNRKNNITIYDDKIYINGNLVNGNEITIVKGVDIELGLRVEGIYNTPLKFIVNSNNMQVDEIIKEANLYDEVGNLVNVEQKGNSFTLREFDSDHNQYTLYFKYKIELPQEENNKTSKDNKREINIIVNEIDDGGNSVKEVVNKTIEINVLDLDLD